MFYGGMYSTNLKQGFRIKQSYIGSKSAAWNRCWVYMKYQKMISNRSRVSALKTPASGSSTRNLSSSGVTREAAECSGSLRSRLLANRMSFTSSGNSFELIRAPLRVLAGRVINHLENANKDCSYYFFSHSRKSTSDLGRCLRSIAYQMALLNPRVRDRLVKMQQDGVQFDKDSYQFLWKRVFVGAIFSVELHQPHYWVIDALDECLHGTEFFSMLAKIEEAFPLRIFITSRVSPGINKRPLSENVQLFIESIPIENTMNDIRLFIMANIHRLPLDEDDQDAQNDLITTIIAKSNGCFLWVKLVIDQLSNVYSSSGIRKVLAEVPAGMDSLYTRIIETLSQAAVNKSLAKAILRWTVCAGRPLSTDELRCALQLDINDKVFNLDNTIACACGQLVYVDNYSRACMVHQTARDFLLNLDQSNEFSVRLEEGHGRLAAVCLKFLCGPEMKAPSSRRPGLAQLPKKRSAFVDYACTSFYEHIKQTTSADDTLLSQLGAFLDSPELLSWIEYIAQTGNLNHLIRTGKVFNGYLERRAKHSPLLGKEVQRLEAWGTDLIRLVGRFGTNLLSSPSSIYALIPPFCPPESALYKQFGSTLRGISVSGLSTASWDDRLSSIIYGRAEQPAAVACNDSTFAVGMSKGTIYIYHLMTCQRTCQIKHGEAVKVLEFNSSGDRLASGGRHKIRVWDLLTDDQVWEFEVSQQTLTLAFFDTDKILLAALRDNQMMYFDLSEGCVVRTLPWLDERNGEQFRPSRPPIKAAVSSELKLLGINYRGRLIIWDLEADSFLGVCGKEELQQYAGQSVTQTQIMDFVFNPSPNLQLLAASYQDGSLALFDPIEGITHQIASRADAQTLASSPDGRTLASGDAFGTIQLFEFETLKIIYRLKSDDVGINKMVFSSDSLRFIDIRGPQCNVWGPAILIRNETDEEHSDTLSTAPREVQITEADDVASIVAIACHRAIDIVFCGAENGSITVFDSGTGRKVQELYVQTSGIVITFLALCETNSLLASADLSGKVLVRKIVRHLNKWKAEEPILNLQVEEAISQVLLNSFPPRLLISSPCYDSLYGLDGSLIAKYEFPKREVWRYARHPKQRHQLLLIMDGRLQILAWDNLKVLTAPDGITLGHERAEKANIKSLSTHSNGSVMSIEFSGSAHHGASDSFVLWDISSLDPQVTHLKPVELPSSLSMRLRHIAGSLGTKLVFLEVNGWISSIDLKNTAAASYSRHFFVPSDWLSSAGELIFQLTAKGNFIFVKGDEIAVIKNRLEYTQTVPISRVGSW